MVEVGKDCWSRVEVALSVLAGARPPAAVAEWIADAPRWVLLTLGFACDPPHRQPSPRHGHLRNLAISVFRQDGHTNIAAATRHQARRPGRPLTTLGWL